MIHTLINRLKRLNVNIDVVDGKLDIQAAKGIIDDALLTEIRSHKAELIDFINDYKEKKSNHIRIEKLQEQTDYPLSSAQRRLWMLSQFKENSVAYHIPSKILLKGGYDIENFKKAVWSTIERHEILRTVFRENEFAQIRQYIVPAKALNFDIDFQDFRNEPVQQESVEAYLAEDNGKPFDLENGPLIRASLIQLSNDQYVFYYNMHHIISDGWSMKILVQDVLAYYELFTGKRTLELPELRIQYKEYAMWQLKQLQGTTSDQHKEYWLQQLSGELPLVDLPAEKKRPVLKTNNGGNLGVFLSGDLTRSLQEFCLTQGGTSFMGLVTALKILLFRYTAQDDIIIGVPVAGRNHIDLEDQIGFYVNTLAIRNTIKTDDNFKLAFQRIRETVLNAYQHQEYPFDSLVEDLEVRRDTSRNAIFDIVVNLKSADFKNQEIPAEKLDQLLEIGPGMNKFDLEFTFEEADNHTLLVVNYNTDVYEKETIAQFILHYRNLLGVLLSTPDHVIGKLNYLSEEETHQLLYTFNDTTVDYPRDETVVSLFTAQAEKTPQAIALSFEERELTYKELDSRAGRLANYLIDGYGVQTGDLIGVKLERNEYLIVVLLAILKTGSAYVCIDPNYPEQLINYIESDSQCKLTIDSDLINRFLLQEDKQCYLVKREIQATDLAYVMYTSGSTGKPKGVMVKHRGILRLVKSSNYYQFSDTDVLLATGAQSFDATTFEFWGCLLNGARLELCSYATLLDGELLSKQIKSRGVNVMWFTAGWLSQLVDHEISLFETLHTVISGGDKLSPGHIHKLRMLYPGLEIINGYGPTENTTFSLTYNIKNVSGDIPLGYPISNSTVYILDQHQNPVPAGVTGEIYLGGDGLAAGYLNRSALTAEKFIPHPFLAGEKLYKTGDLGRWSRNGYIEFLGRIDNQVKIRGYRIELGEIEQAILIQKNIDQAVVLVKVEEGQKIIVAYLVGEQVEVKALHDDLKLSLPEYMVPAYFVLLDEMPLTSNGKIDHKKLLAYENLNALSGAYEEPSNAQEQVLNDLCKDILKKENISMSDSFYDVGGDSIKIIQLISMLRKMGFSIKAEQVLMARNLKELAKNMNKQDDPEIEIQQETVQKELSYQTKVWKPGDKIQISENQRRMMKIGEGQGTIGPFNITNYDARTFETMFREFLAIFPALCIEFIKHEDVIYQRFVAAAEVKLPLIHAELDFEDEALIKDTIQHIFEKPYDLFHGELLRLFVFSNTRNPEQAVFLFAMHHAVTDLHTNQVLHEALTQFLIRKSPVENKWPYTNMDFALWQQKYLLSEEAISSRNFWRQQLKTLVSAAENVAQRITPESTGIRHICQNIILTDERAEAFKAFSTALNLPLSVVFMGFHQLLLEKFYGNEFCYQSVIVNGRENLISGFDTSAVLGAINNYLPIGITPNYDLPADEIFFQKVYLQYLKAREHQLIPYEVMRRDLFETADIDLDYCNLGVFNFKREKTGFNEQFANSLDVRSEVSTVDMKFDLICLCGNNGFNIKLICKEDTYFHATASTLNLEQLINQFLKSIPLSVDV